MNSLIGNQAPKLPTWIVQNGPEQAPIPVDEIAEAVMHRIQLQAEYLYYSIGCCLDEAQLEVLPDNSWQILDTRPSPAPRKKAGAPELENLGKRFVYRIIGRMLAHLCDFEIRKQWHCPGDEPETTRRLKQAAWELLQETGMPANPSLTTIVVAMVSVIIRTSNRLLSVAH